jgi:hypothetical protein
MMKYKKFEYIIKKAFNEVEGASIDRINDNTARFKSVSFISDFIVYKNPTQLYLECKTTQKNQLNFKSNITDAQWNGLFEKSKIDGVHAGLIIWFIEDDITIYISIETLHQMEQQGAKSISTKDIREKKVPYILIGGKKKITYWEYNLESFFEQLEINRRVYNG